MGAFRISIVVPTFDRNSSALELLGDLKRLGVLERDDVEIIFVQNNAALNVDLKSRLELLGARCLHQPKRGQAAALNCGILGSEGDVVVFIDDDVRLIDGQWLNKLVAHFADPKIGYVAGNVIAAELISLPQISWEAKGGLSKGAEFKRFDQSFFKSPRFGGVPLRFVACGANSAIRKSILLDVGLYDERFGVGSAVGHSQSHEICYKVFRAGYDAVYDTNATVSHVHPQTWADLRKRMYNYGVGDTAVQLHFFIKYGDFRGLREAFLARHAYLLGKLFKRLRGNYPMPMSAILAGLAGASAGPFVYLRACIQASWAQYRDRKPRFGVVRR
ncbi:glycosyltransferase [Rhizobium sp. C104]|uniref:glycosyltransferase n=1 Tax=Rhizobium sp. C104 TaxID=2917727 RepID=UPI001EF77B29|nr:glycosyltransferase [Rhizobium sp. C104]ULJ77365.1 glycosyltransferase [Rhizobium sp. C104]